MSTGRDGVTETHLSSLVSRPPRGQVPLAQVWDEVVGQMATTPWLVRVLLGQGRALATRVAAQYLRVCRLPRRVRRALARRGALSLAGAAVLLALAGPEVGWADNIHLVGSGSDLATAITNANSQIDGYVGTNTLSLTTNIAVESALDAVTSTIVIAGNNFQIAGSSKLTASIFTVQSKGNLTLQETTVTGGKGDNGGALFNHLGTLTLIQSTLSGNTASGKGGALFNRYGTVTLYNSTVTNNSAGNSGGGLYNYGGHMTLAEGSLVTGNRASSGGAVGNGYYGRLAVSSSTVTDNVAAEGGGILLNAQATSVTVTASTVSGNTATDQGGGGIRVNYGSVTVSEGSLISNNQGEDGGGLFINEVATATIANSTVSGNVATSNGGGIYVHSGKKKFLCVASRCNSKYGCYCTESTSVYGSKLTVTYSTLADNTATLGGGINSSRYTSVTLTNSTLSGNSASENGGGLNASPDGSDSRAHVKLSFSTLTGNTAKDDGGGISTGEHTDLTLKNTLVSGNHASTGPEIRTNTKYADISFGYNNLFGYNSDSGLSGQGAESSDIVPSASLSAILNPTLADNGGLTYTHALVSGSPAINAANLSCSSTNPAKDQREYGRPASGSNVCDIGAFEYGATDTPVPATLSSGQATEVAAGRPKGSLRLRFTALLPQALDLRQATLRVPGLLTERGAELVEGVAELRFVLRAEEAKAHRATFELLPGGRAQGKVTVRVRGNVLQGQVRLDQVQIEEPRLCVGERAELASEVVVSDGQHPAVHFLVREPWGCERGRDGRVRGLEVSPE